jgi:hypothetical protein
MHLSHIGIHILYVMVLVHDSSALYFIDIMKTMKFEKFAQWLANNHNTMNTLRFHIECVANVSIHLQQT